MRSIEHLPAEEQKHYLKCNGCDEYLDCRNLSDVLAHEHGSMKIPDGKYNSKRKGDNTEHLKEGGSVNLN